MRTGRIMSILTWAALALGVVVAAALVGSLGLALILEFVYSDPKSTP